VVDDGRREAGVRDAYRDQRRTDYSRHRGRRAAGSAAYWNHLEGASASRRLRYYDSQTEADSSTEPVCVDKGSLALDRSAAEVRVASD
jgi:hypothetical protein